MHQCLVRSPLAMSSFALRKPRPFEERKATLEVPSSAACSIIQTGPFLSASLHFLLLSVILFRRFHDLRGFNTIKDRRRNNCRMQDVGHVYNVPGTMESCPTRHDGIVPHLFLSLS